MIEEKIKCCTLRKDGYFDWCEAMNIMLHPEANAEVKGLIQKNVYNIKTNIERCIGVAYRESSKFKSRSIMLNVCPWCEARILNVNHELEKLK